MLKDALRVINEMQEHRVIDKYAIGGAIGALFYLEPILTKDIDIFVVLPVAPNTNILSLSSIYEYLLQRGYKEEGEYIMIADWPVQFLPATTELELEGLNNAVQAETEGVNVWVMPAEHLAAICLRTGRLKDYARLAAFIEQEVLDMKKFQDIVIRFKLTVAWKRFENEFTK